MADLARRGECIVTAPGGLFMAVRPAREVPSGIAPETIRVLDQRGRQVGTFIDFPTDPVAIHWRTAKGDPVTPPTLEALLEVCSPVNVRARVQTAGEDRLTELQRLRVQGDDDLLHGPVLRSDCAAPVARLEAIDPPAHPAGLHEPRSGDLASREEHTLAHRTAA